MTEVTESVDTPVVDELAALKARADLLGISYHPTIGLEKLRDKVNAAVTSDGKDEDDESQAEEAEPVQESPAAKRLRLRNEAARLVRIRLTCLNPAKKEWDGEIITAGNAAVGTFKKFVPFHGADEGWHVPNIIYKQLANRECQIFVTSKDVRGNKVRVGKMIREFAIEVLPPLTEDELKDLAQRQAMAKSID